MLYAVAGVAEEVPTWPYVDDILTITPRLRRPFLFLGLVFQVPHIASERLLVQ